MNCCVEKFSIRDYPVYHLASAVSYKTLYHRYKKNILTDIQGIPEIEVPAAANKKLRYIYKHKKIKLVRSVQKLVYRSIFFYEIQ